MHRLYSQREPFWYANIASQGNYVLSNLTRFILFPKLPLLSSPLLSKFDLVAVRPGSEKLMQQCLQFDFDILSLSLERRQLFHVKRPQVHVAVEKVSSTYFILYFSIPYTFYAFLTFHQGVMFEIGYAVGLRDRNARKQLIGNACSLSRVSGGKNLLLSSGAKNIMVRRLILCSLASADFFANQLTFSVRNNIQRSLEGLMM